MAAPDANDIIRQTNAYRVSKGLKPLQINDALQKAAEERVADMAATGNFSHTIATTTALKTGNAFIQKHNYSPNQSNRTGENLAVQFDDASSTMEAWKNSPTHNANLVRPDYNDIGVAVAMGKHNGVEAPYVVQFFGGKTPSEMNTPLGKPPAEIQKAPLGTLKPIKGLDIPSYKAPALDMRMAGTTPQR